jgi:hypothetical protein
MNKREKEFKKLGVGKGKGIDSIVAGSYNMLIKEVNFNLRIILEWYFWH